MRITIFDVEHGACALIESPDRERIALIDCGTNTTTGWNPSDYVRYVLKRELIDYLIITNADQDHYTNLATLKTNVRIRTFFKNPHFKSDAFKKVKLQSGSLSKDAIAYLELLESHTHPVTTPFNEGMGGIRLRTFYNRYPSFTDTNNLSLVAFVKYGPFSILFPGDLERSGWLALLSDSEFKMEIAATDILVASHHGRENGYCPELFEDWGPEAVIVSDKPIVHETQKVPQYQNCLRGDGIFVVGEDRKRHVLTTRKDGAITFDVSPDGSYHVYKSK